MASQESYQIRKTLVNDRETLAIPLAVQRQEWAAAAAQVPLLSGITVTPVAAPTVAGEWLNPATSTTQGVLFYLHGGGYVAGSPLTHRELAARLSLVTGLRVLLIDYGLAPEHPFPAALEDAGAGYCWLLQQGVPPAQIVIGGDSAGGGLAVATLLWIKAQNLPLPAAGFLLSPWLDLALTGASFQTHATLDPLCSYDGLLLAAKQYLADADAQTPYASPLYGELVGLPPLLIQVGEHEVLLSDATRFAERAQAAGVAVTLEVWPAMWHVWQGWAGVLPEGEEAIAQIGSFVRQHLSK